MYLPEALHLVGSLRWNIVQLQFSWFALSKVRRDTAHKPLKWGLLVLLLFLIASASSQVCADGAATNQSPQKWALVIGISKNYQEPRLALKYPAKDALKFRNYLVDEAGFPADHVKLLIDADATKANILDALGNNWLPQKSHPEDSVVIYYSGGCNPDESFPALFAYDSNPASVFSTAIQLSDFSRTIAARLTNRHCLLIFDCTINPDKVAKESGCAVLSSNQIGQGSWESELYAGSIFTHHLLETAREYHGQVATKAAFSYLRKRVQFASTAEGRKQQTPQLISSTEGYEVNLLYPKSTPAPPASAVVASNRKAITQNTEPQRAVAMYNLGLGAYKQGSRDAAVIFFKRAVELDPNLADAHYNLAVLRMCTNQFSDAIVHLNEVLRIKPGDADATHQLGLCLAKTGVEQRMSPANNAVQTPVQTQPAKTPINPSAPVAVAPPTPINPSTPVAVASPTPINPSTPVAVESSTPINKPIRDKWALVVGIGNFADPTINKLKFASKDALDFKNYLIQKANFAPDHVRTLIDSEATRERILDEFGDAWLPRVAGPNDLVVIFVSTHGSPADLDVGSVNYLVAYDTDPKKLFSRGIPMQELCRLIKSRICCDRVLIVLDTCFSGNTAPTGKGLTRTGNISANEVALGTGQLVICSSSTNQRSWESNKYQNGIFTKQLIDALSCRGPQTTLGQAFEALKDQVADEARREHGVDQTPCMNGKWSGNELILSVPPANPKPGL